MKLKLLMFALLLTAGTEVFALQPAFQTLEPGKKIVCSGPTGEVVAWFVLSTGLQGQGRPTVDQARSLTYMLADMKSPESVLIDQSKNFHRVQVSPASTSALKFYLNVQDVQKPYFKLVAMDLSLRDTRSFQAETNLNLRGKTIIPTTFFHDPKSEPIALSNCEQTNQTLY